MPRLLALILLPLLIVAACGGGGSGGGGLGGGGLVCTAESATLAQQLQNPVTLLATDNNGVIIELPSVPAAGAQDPAGGVLVLGIGTQANNSLGAATVLDGQTDTGQYPGSISATLNGTGYPNSYLDSGSNGNFFTDKSLTTCPSPNSGFYCPNSTVQESANLQSPSSGAMLAANFSVANAATLFAGNNGNSTAYNNLGGTNADATSVDLGLPFFFGQNIFTGFENPATGAPPYFAYGGAQTRAPPGPPNVEPITVDAGPAGLNPTSINTPFVSVTVCVPGTATCQTIDHIEVDTGSVGLRLIASVLTVALPALMDASNRPLAECEQFADGTTWGSVATADIKLPTSGAKVSAVNVQLIGDLSVGSPPSGCTGTAENTVATFGANGIIGVGSFVNDCNSTGDCTPGSQSANYYFCTG